MRHNDDSVPLWRDFLIFTGVLARRLAKYALLVFLTLHQVVFWLFYTVLSLKNAAVRLLMRRCGFFAPIQRWGLLTLSGGAVFSLVITPSVNSLLTSYQVQQVLGQYDLSTQNSVVLSNQSEALSLQHKPNVVKPSDPSRQEIIEYEVKGGDTLSLIGEKYLVSVEALSYVNNLSASSLLHPGDIITIPPVDGLIYKVKEGDSVASIAARHNVSPQAVVDANVLEAPFIIHAGDELVVPGGEVPVPEPAKNVYLADRTAGGLSLQTIPGAAASGSLMMPTMGSITQYFNWYHPAIDIANKGCGQTVVAADSGTIYFAGWWAGGGGNTVMIDHGNGLITKYAHLSGFERTGGSVAKGEVIGYVGATGRAYGCHLHYVIEQNGRAVNPLNF